MNIKPVLALAVAACSQPELNSLELGNIEFKLENPSEFSSQEKKALFENMEAAHAKLAETLGGEVMRLDERRTVSVRRGRMEEARGKTEYTNTEVVVGNDLRPHLKGPGTGETVLTVADLSEPNLAHEFVHIYAQNAFLWSEAFWEGTAYGLTHHLYPKYYPSLEDFQMDVAANPCVAKEIFSKGWDTDQMDVAFQGGIKEPELQKLIHAHWALMWDAYADAHPDFFRKFFLELDRLSSNGKYEFSRDQLWIAARAADPSFDAWVRTQGQSIREMEKQTKAFSVATGKDQVSVFNFQARPRREKASSFDVPLMTRMSNEEMRLETDGRSFQIPNQAFIELNAAGLSSLSRYQITLGGHPLPLLQGKSCTPVH